MKPRIVLRRRKAKLQTQYGTEFTAYSVPANHEAALLFRRRRPRRAPSGLELKLVADATAIAMRAFGDWVIKSRTGRTTTFEIISGPQAHFDKNGNSLKRPVTYNWVRITTFVGNQRVPKAFRRGTNGLLKPVEI